MPRAWTLEERFWWKIDKTNTCWNWTGYTKNGYGVIDCLRVANYTHRLSWEWRHGPIPEGMCVLHRCDNRRCVRPDHLFLGTKGDNARDCAAKGRNVAQKHPEKRRGEASSSARLTEQEVRAIRDRHAAGGISYKQLANEYRMEKSTIGKIVTRKLWPHI